MQELVEGNGADQLRLFRPRLLSLDKYAVENSFLMKCFQEF